jgi:ribonucleoside-diphosphate reductase alpha chain
MVLSCADAISKAFERYLQGKKQYNHQALHPAKESRVNYLAGQCPECGNALEYESGCLLCRMCGYSKCG